MAARRIGVLALQGDFDAHSRALLTLGCEVILVKTPRDLAGLHGIALPGGESTTQLRLLASSQLRAPLAAAVAAGLPTLATCAGLILLARRVLDPEQESLGLLDVTVARNAWGRQLDSFEATSDRLALPLVFIRAPRIRDVGGEVEVLDTFDGEPILVRQANVVAATFHPELTESSTVVDLAFGGAARIAAGQSGVGNRESAVGEQLVCSPERAEASSPPTSCSLGLAAG